MVIAQITDLHVRPAHQAHQWTTDTSEWLRKAVNAINALSPRPDLVIATGDIANAGRAIEYVRARAILEALVPPLFVIPGNHDNPAALERVFGDRIGRSREPRSLTYVLDDYPLRVLAVDSTSPGWPGAALDDERLAWIESVLTAAPERPTFLVMHHPPLRTGMHYLDALGFRGDRAFERLIRRHGNVIRIACGHIHRATEQQWNGTVVSTSVSTAPQFVPELFMRKAIGITRERPGYTLYRFDGDRNVRAATQYIGD